MAALVLPLHGQDSRRRSDRRSIQSRRAHRATPDVYEGRTFTTAEAGSVTRRTSGSLSWSIGLPRPVLT